MEKAPGADCANCPLKDKSIAKTQGPDNADTIIVSRSPGFHEAQVGRPFSGPSGDVLNHLLKANGIDRKDIAVTNVVLCAPDAGKVPPEAIKACSGRLKNELSTKTLIIAAGSEAVNAIIGRGSIDKYRGYRIERGSQTLIATNNPALVLRDDSTYPNLVKDFKRAFNPLPEPTLPTVEWTTEVDRALEMVTLVGQENGNPYRAADIESRGGLSHKAELVSIQFALAGDKAYVIGEPASRDESVQKALRQLFLRTDLRFIWHNGKFDTKILRYGYGIHARVDEDTLLLSYDCDERPGVHALDYLLMEEFGWPNYEPQSVKNFKKTGIIDDEIQLYTYAGWDVAGTYQLFENLHRRAESQDVMRPYRELLLPGTELAINMELRGIIYDVNGAADILEEEVNPELNEITKRMRDISNMPLLNPASPKQMSALFYDRWHISHEMQKRPDMKHSVDDSARKEILAGRFKTLDELKAKTSLEQAKATALRQTIIAFNTEYDRFQELKKQQGTYLIGLIKEAEGDPEHRIYTDLLFHGTNSGRLSSRKPNLQNITRPKEGLPNIRNLFLASPGRKIVNIDYSQAELRAIAAFSGDKELTAVYEKGIDLHALTAERFYGKDFTSEQRSKAKNMNFGMFYRQSAQTFQEKHGIPEPEARKYIEWAWSTFTGVAEWEKGIEKEIHANGFLVSPFGRKRRFYLITRENKQAVYREGINFYPQTTASDLTLHSAITIAKHIDGSKAALCLTVHDSILSDVVEDYVEEYSKIATQIMESTAKEQIGWTIPFKVDVGVGTTWGEAK